MDPKSTQKYWRQESPGDPVSELARQCNRMDLHLAELCAPESEDDIENHISTMSVRLGRGRGFTRQLCDVGLMLLRMPLLHREAVNRGHLTISHLVAVALAVDVVSDEAIEQVEQDLLTYLSPRRNGQAMVGRKALRRELSRIIEQIEPESTPIDGEEEPANPPEVIQIDDETDGPLGWLTAGLRKDRLAEVIAALTAVRNAANAAGERCTFSDALVLLARGTVTASVVINVYRDVRGGPAWVDGVGWLDAVATEEWVARATHLRASTDSVSSGYAPTEAQQARVRGRDGTCRFPGCETPAHRCDIDHIRAYNHDDPGEGGPTDTANLHCLCRRHHNLKTSGLWHLIKHADDAETWCSVDGRTTAISVPTGPMAGHGRQTWAEGIARKAATRHGLNLRRRSDPEVDDPPPF